MIVEVLSWDKMADCHFCRAENGETLRLDLLVSGDLGELRGEDLVGKEVEYTYSHPYVSIAHGVRIVY